MRVWHVMIERIPAASTKTGGEMPTQAAMVDEMELGSGRSPMAKTGAEGAEYEEG